MEILRDSAWQFVGVVIAILALLITVWIYWLQKNRKRFSYEILASSELLTTSEEIHGRIEVLFDKRPVQNVRLIILRFTNDGNIPILDTDFYEPLQISFGGETKILSAEIVGCSPQSFNPKGSIHEDGHSFSVLPTLINSQDSFTIKFLLAQHARGSLKIYSRIVGISSITEGSGTTPPFTRVFVLGFIVAGVSLISYMVTAIIGAIKDWNKFFAIATIVSVAFVMAIGLASTLVSAPPRKK